MSGRDGYGLARRRTRLQRFRGIALDLVLCAAVGLFALGLLATIAVILLAFSNLLRGVLDI